jgi:hypothetical protein
MQQKILSFFENASYALEAFQNYEGAELSNKLLLTATSQCSGQSLRNEHKR